MKYLYFCTDDTIAAILSAQEIKRVKKHVRFEDKDYRILDEKNRNIQAFVYNIEMISKTRCYVTFPYDHLGKVSMRKWIRLFGFIPWRSEFLCHVLPKNGRAIVFDVRNETDIQHHYMQDRQIAEKMYCESFSIKPLKIINAQEIDFPIALEIIGLKPPYLSFPFKHWEDNRVLISPNYEIVT